jgi:hypothetical protein
MYLIILNLNYIMWLNDDKLKFELIYYTVKNVMKFNVFLSYTLNLMYIKFNVSISENLVHEISALLTTLNLY